MKIHILIGNTNKKYSLNAIVIDFKKSPKTLLSDTIVS